MKHRRTGWLRFQFVFVSGSSSGLFQQNNTNGWYDLWHSKRVSKLEIENDRRRMMMRWTHQESKQRNLLNWCNTFWLEILHRIKYVCKRKVSVLFFINDDTLIIYHSSAFMYVCMCCSVRGLKSSSKSLKGSTSPSKPETFS